MLIALACAKLELPLQLAALRVCVRHGAPIDVLLAGDPADTPLPTGLLLRLEHSGLDYRFGRIDGEISNAIERYLQRGRAPCTVLVTDTAPLSAPCLQAFQASQHRLITLTPSALTEASGTAQRPLSSPAFPLSLTPTLHIP